MNRRDFIKSLVAAGAALAIAERITDEALAIPPSPQYIAHIEGRWIERIWFHGIEGSPREAIFRISRSPGAVLFEHHFNTYGGLCELVLPIGGAWYVSREYPVTIDADFDGTCAIFSSGENQSYMDYFVLRIYSPPTYQETFLAKPPQQELLLEEDMEADDEYGETFSDDY